MLIVYENMIFNEYHILSGNEVYLPWPPYFKIATLQTVLISLILFVSVASVHV